MFVWNHKCVLKDTPILLGAFVKCPTSSISLVVISYFCYSRIVCFFHIWSPTSMGTLSMSIIVLIFTPVILTTWSVHLKNYCVILRSRRYILLVYFLMVVERHSFMRQYFRGRMFVCCHCRNHPKNPFLQDHCFQLSMFNLIIVL